MKASARIGVRIESCKPLRNTTCARLSISSTNRFHLRGSYNFGLWSLYPPTLSVSFA